MNRRSLFKYLGAAIVAAPFVAVGPVEAIECGAVPPEQEFLEKAFECGGDIGLTLEELEYERLSYPAYVPEWQQGPLLRDDSQVVYWGNDVLEAKVHYTPPIPSTMTDPLGEWGILGWKVRLPNGEQCGSWIEIADAMGSDVEVLREALPFLREVMERKMAIVAPNVTVTPAPVSIPDYQGDSWLLKNGTFIF